MTQVGTRSHALTRAELLALPAVTDIVTAGRAFGIGRTTSHSLARSGDFPCDVMRVGGVYRVLTADLHRVLGITPENDEGGAGPAQSDAA